MASRTAEHEIPYIVAVIPFLYTFEERWQKLQGLSTAPIDPLHATDKTEQILAGLDVSTISVRNMILEKDAASERYFISLTDGHLSEYGHEQLARWVFHKMEQQGLVDG